MDETDWVGVIVGLFALFGVFTTIVLIGVGAFRLITGHWPLI